MGNALVKSLDRNQIFWTLLGPVCLIVNLCFLSLHPVTPLAYSYFVSIAGLGLCCYWKRKGLAAALSILAISTIYHSIGMSGSERIWEVGGAISIALGFLITLLSMEEAENFIFQEAPNVETEHANRLELQAQKFQAEIQILKEQSDLIQKKVVEKEQFLTIARNEFLSAAAENEMLQRDLIHSRQLESIAQEKLTEKQMVIEKLAQEFNEESKIDKLQIAQLKRQIQLNAADLENIKQKLAEEVKKTQLYETEVQFSASRLQALENELALKSKQEPLQVMNIEKTEEWRSIRKAEGLYHQMREQFEEKSNTLDQTRKELFHAEEKLLKLQRELDERGVYGFAQDEKDLLDHIIHTERFHTSNSEVLQKEIKALEAILDEHYAKNV